ncbi:hypothetical protein MKW98_012913 [Papaver atlanticum]|uniref:PGG domain-containing protein n=1 Tax=Papaver atlanticum TaxID=357466 RepID=A0AAD4XF77_9MAGN|nr:hypothetical protein MKW98_012913 [Papaver atlanticum]
MSTVSQVGESYDHESHQEMMLHRLVSQETMVGRLETTLSKLLVSQQQTLEFLRSNSTLKNQDNSSADKLQEDVNPNINPDDDGVEEEEITEFPVDDNVKDDIQSDEPPPLVRSSSTLNNTDNDGDEAEDIIEVPVDKQKDDLQSDEPHLVTSNSTLKNNSSSDEQPDVSPKIPTPVRFRNYQESPKDPTKSQKEPQPSQPEISPEILREGCDQLSRAATHGDWNGAREFFIKYPKVVPRVSNDNWRDVLHCAVIENQLVVLEEILKLMPPEAPDYQTRAGDTALHVAAAYGYTAAAKLLVNKNATWTQIRDKKGRVPLELAVRYVTAGQRETVKYLYSVTRDVEPSPFAGHEGSRLLYGAISANLFGIAMSLVERFPILVVKKYQDEDICGLEAMTQRQLAFRSGCKLIWWKQYIYSSIKVDKDSIYERDNDITNINERDENNDLESFGTGCTIRNEATSSKVFPTSGKGIMSTFVSVSTPVLHIKQCLYKQKLMHEQARALASEMFQKIRDCTDSTNEYFQATSFIKTAIKHGTIEVVEEFLSNLPALIWLDLGGQTIMQMAVVERNEMALNLIIKKSGKNKMDLINMKDENGNTLLHYVAKLASPYQLKSISGAVLQMQRELQWFKGIQSILAEEDKVFKRNKKGDIAEHVFTAEHKDLVEKGEKWLKDTSGSCMVVAALVATVAFAAAFTVPGGNISDSSSSKNGTPVFLGSPSFVIFASADALSLFSSITSVIMFLAIYTSRFAEQDFLVSLPRKMIIGLATLFISMATILIAFVASMSIVLGERFPWAPIPIALFSCIPPISFAFLQLPLFFEMVRGTFWSYPLKEHIKNSKKKVD